MPEPTNLALVRIVKDLERLRAEADAANLALLAHLIDIAIIEARQQANK